MTENNFDCSSDKSKQRLTRQLELTKTEKFQRRPCKVKVSKKSEERQALGERGICPRSCGSFSRVFLRLTSTFRLPGIFNCTCACGETWEDGVKSDCQMYSLLAFLDFAHLFVRLSVCLSLRHPRPAFHVQDNLLFSCSAETLVFEACN